LSFKFSLGDSSLFMLYLCILFSVLGGIIAVSQYRVKGRLLVLKVVQSLLCAAILTGKREVRNGLSTRCHGYQTIR
jgi:hypothetical protein